MVHGIKKMLCTYAFFFVFSGLLGCRVVNKPDNRYYADYSLVASKGQNILTEEEVSNNFQKKTYFSVKYPDSSYQEIYPVNVKDKFWRKILVYKKKSYSAYYICHNVPVQMMRDDFYLAYKDSTYKKYFFLARAGGTNALFANYTFWKNDSAAIFWLTLDDTSGFLNNIWDFDLNFKGDQVDSDTVKIERKTVFTLVELLKEKKLYEE